MLNFVSGYPSWHEYLESMAKDGTWGDHVVLFAAANHFQTPIRIISSLDHEIVVQPDHALANTNPLVLGHIHELHYVSLQPRQGKTFFPITNILVFFFFFLDLWELCLWNLYTYGYFEKGRRKKCEKIWDMIMPLSKGSNKNFYKELEEAC